MLLNDLEKLILSNATLDLPNTKLLITTINAHSYNVAKTDKGFLTALKGSDILLADGIGVVLAYRLLGKSVQKMAGADLFKYEMERLQAINGTCFFLGSTQETLEKIKEKTAHEYPNVKVYSFAPPYTTTFSATENAAMVDAINAIRPDALFIGLTAPKQEKWAFIQKEYLDVGHICCIGAVFDFYAGTVKRPPQWMIGLGLEWLGRLISEPQRLWKRYLISSPIILLDTLLHKFALRM
jgi:N-acetylglucosaminyldiphosphoundecaprenol N-acetyl-beta-D-mannosaminyltransferase